MIHRPGNAKIMLCFMVAVKAVPKPTNIPIFPARPVMPVQRNTKTPQVLRCSPARVLPVMLLLICSAVLFPLVSMAGPGSVPGVYRQVIDDEHTYRVVKGDILLKVAGKFGVEVGYLMRQNGLKTDRLHIGDTLTVKKSTIVPAETDDGILINIPDRTLYLFEGGILKAMYPVGLGLPSWKTPTGSFKVVRKMKNPTWHVPPSIQREMAAKGERVRTKVPPGPDNPLGRWAVETSLPRILIHETIAPSSVYRFQSHGCIRMRGDDAKDFYEATEKDDAGQIIYRPVKIAVTGTGRVYLEVYKDVYGLGGEHGKLARDMIEGSGLADKVDWAKVEEVVSGQEGIAFDVTKTDRGGRNGQTGVFEGASGGGNISQPSAGALKGK